MLYHVMAEQIAVTKLLADETTITILLLLRTQPLYCRKISTILQKGESQIARRLSQLEKAGIVESEWVHKDRNIKVYFLKTDRIRIQITDEGIGVQYTPEKKEKFFALESIFQVDIPVTEGFIDREDQLALLDQSSFVVLTGIAGIGKTSLASFYAQQLKGRGKKVFWHTFSELDSALFVVKKLAIFLSKYGFPQLLDYVKADSTDMRVVEALLLDHVKAADFAFFFDDYHLVTDESMNHLFNHLKKCEGRGKICVISRYKPPFISVFDNILEIRLEEMGKEAVKQFLNSKGVDVDEKTLEKVAEKIGGHPLALEFLCHAAAESDPVTLMEEIPPFEIGSYLWDEIYSRLDPEEQQLLVTLSIFRRPVDMEAVKLMCPFATVRTVTKQLIRKNLLKKIDNKYIHHAVTRMFCLEMVHNPKKIHQKAAEFYLKQETSKDIMEALYHLVRAGSHKEGADVILNNYEMLINEGHGSQLLAFCKVVDVPLLYQSFLMEVEGEIYTLQGEYDRAVQCFTIPLEHSSGLQKASLYRKLGEVYEKKREYKTAEQLFLQGLDTLKGEDAVEQGNILVNLATVYAELSEPDRALSCCEKALTWFSQSGHKKGIAHVYNQMGEIHRYSNTGKALELLSSSLEISQKIGDVQKVASTYAAMGNVLYERGETDEAVQYYEKSLELSEQIGNMVGIARCCNNIGVKYALEWKWSYAMEYYHKTLSICEKIKDKKGIAFSYSNLGRAYSRLGSWEKALDYFHASLQLREELFDKREMSYLYYNIGLTFQDMGDFKEGLHWMEKSLQVRESINYTLGVAYCCASMGEIYGEMGEYDKALIFLEKALHIHEREKGTWMVATTKIFSAQVYVNEKDFEKAVLLAEDTIKTFEKVGSIESLTRAHRVAAEAHLGLGSTEEAIVHAEASLRYALKMSSPQSEGRARRVVGSILCETGEYERAAEEFRLSMWLLKKYSYERAKTYVEFGLLCRRIGQEKKFRFLLWKALSIFRDAGATSREEYCRQYLK